MANKNFKVKTGLDLPAPLPVEMGGTGQTTTSNTLNALLPIQTDNSGKYLTTDGTTTSWITAPVAYTRGMTSQRPASPTAGDLFFNLQKKAFEVWTGSAWVSVAVNGAVPDAPTLGTVTLSGLTASIPFTGPTDYGDASITSYTITSNPGSISASGASSPISLSGLSASTAYTFTGTATNAYGVSLSSSSSNSVTTASVPGAPTSVTVSDPGSDGYAYVQWTAPASNGGSAITDYVIEYSSNSGSSWTTFSDGVSTNTNATVTGLLLNTSYIFRVSATNLVGTGTASTASSSFTTITHVAGSYDAILSTVLGAGGASSVTINNIPQTYRHLQLRYISRDSRTASNSDQSITFNGDTGSNYSYHHLSGDGGTGYSGGTGSLANINLGNQPGGQALSGAFGIGVVDIFDYTNTNKFKTIRALSGHDQNGSGWAMTTSGNWRSTAAITSITFTPLVAPYVQYSSFTLYGVK